MGEVGGLITWSDRMVKGERGIKMVETDWGAMVQNNQESSRNYWAIHSRLSICSHAPITYSLTPRLMGK